MGGRGSTRSSATAPTLTTRPATCGTSPTGSASRRSRRCWSSRRRPGGAAHRLVRRPRPGPRAGGLRRVELASDLGRAVAERFADVEGRGDRRAGAPGARHGRAPTAAPARGLEDATALTTELRMVKSPAELEVLAEAARISDLGMAAGLAAVADGAREVEMAAAAEHAIRAAGAELSFTTVAGAGPRTALGTFLPGDRRCEPATPSCSTAARASTAITATCAARSPSATRPGARAGAGGGRGRRRGRHRGGTARRGRRRSARGGPRRRRRRRARRAWWGEFMPHGAAPASTSHPTATATRRASSARGWCCASSPACSCRGRAESSTSR